MFGEEKAIARLGLWLGLGIWALIMSISLIVFLDPRPEDITVGRMAQFLGLQAMAGAVGVMIWELGRMFRRGTTIRRLSRVPLALALCIMSGMTAMTILAVVSR